MTTLLFRENLTENVKRLGDILLDDLEKYFNAIDCSENANQNFREGILKEFDDMKWKELKTEQARLRYLNDELNLDANNNTVKNITTGLRAIFRHVSNFGKHSIEYQRELLENLVDGQTESNLTDIMEAEFSWEEEL